MRLAALDVETQTNVCPAMDRPLVRSAESQLWTLLGWLTLACTGLGVIGCSDWGEFKPTITAEVSSQTVIAGQTAVFRVRARGTGPLRYQWFKNGVAVPHANFAACSMVAEAGDNGSVMAVNVSNTNGTAVSRGRFLLLTKPSMTTQPVDQSVSARQTATFNAAASATAPLHFQWYQDGTPIPGATSSVYTTPATALLDSGELFLVVVEDLAGSVTSQKARLTVSPASPALAFSPVSPVVDARAAFAVHVASDSAGAVAYTVVRGPARTVGSMVIPTGAGPVVLAARQAAAGNYAAATATVTFLVSAPATRVASASKLVQSRHALAVRG